MKKILYISYDGMTDQLGQSQVIPYLSQLTQKGYKFTILSVEKREKFKKTGKEIEHQLSEMGIEWETLIFNRGLPVLSKLYDQWQVNSTARRLQQEKKFDLIHCRSYVAAEAALKLFRRFKLPFLFDMRGFWVDERVDSGQWNLRNPIYKFFYKLYKKKEKGYFASCAHIISLTDRGKEELVNSYNVPADKISVIPCCVDLRHFDYQRIKDEEILQIKKELQISVNDNVLSYLGSLGGWYMTDEMLDFFKVARENNPKLVFLFITHDKKEKILGTAIARGIDPSAIRVQPASRNEVPRYLSVSNWSVFFIKDVYSKKASSPTKQGEIMAMGIPIICNDIGDTGRIVKDSNTGIVLSHFRNEDYTRVAGSMTSLLLLDKNNLRQAAIKYYDLDRGVQVYDNVYSSIFDKEPIDSKEN